MMVDGIDWIDVDGVDVVVSGVGLDGCVWSVKRAVRAAVAQRVRL